MSFGKQIWQIACNFRLQFDVELVSGMMGASEGMQTQPQEPDEEDVEEAFKESEEHQEEMEDFMDSMEKFNLEKAKRRMINSLVQGAAFKGGHMYTLVSDEINRLDPNILNLYLTGLRINLISIINI
jgi:hypothetical protein